MAWVAPDDDDDRNKNNNKDTSDLTEEQRQKRASALDMFANLKGDFDDNLEEIDNHEILDRLGNGGGSGATNHSNGNDDGGDEEDKKKKSLWNLIVEFIDYELIPELHLITMEDNDAIWWYDQYGGIFKQNAESIIRSRLENKFHGKMTNGLTSEALGIIQRLTQSPRNIFNPSINWIATKNCMINIATGQTRAFSPDFLCTTRIPVVYKRCEYSGCLSNFRRNSSKIMNFLHEIMIDKDVELFLRYLAYCLVREYRYNHWMILNGAGQNGKSILIALMERFLGHENVSGETLDRLLHERFAIAQLYERLLNVDADVSAEVVFDNTGIIKKLTGNDLHTGELKYKKPWPFRNYAKLIFSCNKIPETMDLTDAFFRRLIIINFIHQFWGEKDDPHIIDKLCNEREFSMLFNELLARLPSVIDIGVRKVTDEVLEENYTMFMRSANSVKIFVKEALERDQPGEQLLKIDLYDWYLEYCADNGISPESDTAISQKLQNDEGIKLHKTRIKSVQGYYWIGVKKKDWNEYRKKSEITITQNLVNQNYLSPETLDEYK